MQAIPQHPRICPRHLDRIAIVYLRQSSERQVRQNLESQRLQYALQDRARGLGWKKVQVIDMDLGCSAAPGASPRLGFDQVIASVARGEVGIVMSREVSRLSRRDKDWRQLLEVCQLFGTLIGDAEQVYDLSLMDDQLILGIKGTLSVVELKTLQLRLVAGTEEKARRGELVRLLPPGYVRDGLDQVVKDPDQRVQEAIDLVFGKFRHLWSVRQTFLWFHEQAIQLPVNQPRGPGRKLVWKLPSYSFVRELLKNPFYAGAYFYGRRVTRIEWVEGELRRRTSSVHSPKDWKVFLQAHHPEYISGTQFEENQRMIGANSLKCSGEATGSAVRTGQGLLAGLLRCGRCGRRLHVHYRGRDGTAARYLCKGDFDAGGRYCLGFGGSTVDRRFSEELLTVLSPLGIEASVMASKQQNSTQAEPSQALRRQLEQLEYEATRAFDQYNQTDPQNRLVAAELERRWNLKLEEVEKVRQTLQQCQAKSPSPSSEEEQRVLVLGEQIPVVWHSEHCPVELKKKIIRTVIEEIVVNLDEQKDLLCFTIHWQGGTHTQFEMPKPVSGVGRKTVVEDLEVIGQMATRYRDDEIARVLNKLGRRTATDRRWNQQRVARIRQRYELGSRNGAKPDTEILSPGQAARHCQVSSSAIKKLVSSGMLKKEQIVPWAPWEIQRSDLDSEPVSRVLRRLRQTGKLTIEGDDLAVQGVFFQ
jgi:DNA invertase Pin-like site-specific DNA recombinase